jgi:hypothetical protein
VSPNTTTAGSGSITVSVPNGSTGIPFVVQALENVGGTAVVTLSAPGFVSNTFTVTVVPPAIEIQGLATSIAAGAADDSDWYVQVGIPNAGNTAVAQVQDVRAGSPGFVITVTNSEAAVGQLRSDEPAATGQTVTKPIPSGTYYTHNIVVGSTYGLRFDPLAAGSTVVSATGPAGVISTTQANRTVNVTP